MEESIIKFETAKLAKQKGFNEATRYYYLNLGLRAQFKLFDGQNSVAHVIPRFECTAPSQALLQKWLREKHRIFIQMNLLGYDKGIWNYEVCVENEAPIKGTELNLSYEESLEQGLFKALSLLPNSQ